MNTVFIGGGNMASALIGGMVAKGRSLADFRIVEPHPEARSRLAGAYPGAALFAAACAEAIAGAGIVVLAVKPQQMRAAAGALAPFIAGARPPVILTIAAGIRIADLARWLGGAVPIVRAMPNTPALVGRGISGVFAAPGVDAAGRALASAVLAAAGEVVWVDDEARIDAVTAVSGSGPAYVFYFLEALEAAALAQGFPAADARRLALATFDGAVALAQRSGEEPSVLRAQVTSKGGTTEAALAAMEAAGVKAGIAAGVDAAARRAGELGELLGRDG
jgi:pyrroline-5-carboxylate reductase